MKASELREKSGEELNAELLKLREEQFKLRMAKSTGQLGQISSAQARLSRDIARVKTVLEPEGRRLMGSQKSVRDQYRAVLSATKWTRPSLYWLSVV